MSAPEKIYLQDGGDYDAAREVTWCQHSIDEADTAYIRADLAPALPSADYAAALEAAAKLAHKIGWLTYEERNDLEREIRALITKPAQHDALAAHVAAARVEDAAKIEALEARLAEACRIGDAALAQIGAKP